MTLPRDVSGERLVRLLSRYGYEVARQRGSHVTLTSNFMCYEHHLSIPRHGAVRVGTLRSILRLAATYLEMDAEQLRRELFDR